MMKNIYKITLLVAILFAPGTYVNSQVLTCDEAYEDCHNDAGLRAALCMGVTGASCWFGPVCLIAAAGCGIDMVMNIDDCMDIQHACEDDRDEWITWW